MTPFLIRLSKCNLHLALILLSIAFATVKGQEKMTVALRGATIIDGSGAQAERNMTLVITDERVTAMAHDDQVTIPQNARIIDAKGKYAIPGLWDMHVHLGATKDSALPALVANGITAVRDCGGLLREIDDWRVRIETGLMIGPRIVRAGPMLNGREFGIHQIPVTNESEARGAVRALQKAGVDFIKVHRAISREAYFGALDECRKIGLPLIGHIPRTVTPLEASDAGQACIEHIGTLFEGTFTTGLKDEAFASAVDAFLKRSAKDLFVRFAENKTAFTPTLVSQRMVTQFGRAQPNELDKYVSQSARKLAADIQARDKAQLTPEFYKKAEVQFEAGFPLVKMMRESGVLLLAGTDLGPAGTYPGFDLHEELALLVRAGLTPMEAIQAATRNAADFLKLKDSGTIAVGKTADLVILDANPLDAIENTRKIHAVLLRGRFLDRKALDGVLRASEAAAQKN